MCIFLLLTLTLFFFVKFLHMYFKCVVQREEILAVSGFRETLSPLTVRKMGWGGCASETCWNKAGDK